MTDKKEEKVQETPQQTIDSVTEEIQSNTASQADIVKAQKKPMNKNVLALALVAASAGAYFVAEDAYDQGVEDKVAEFATILEDQNLTMSYTEIESGLLNDNIVLKGIELKDKSKETLSVKIGEFNINRKSFDLGDNGIPDFMDIKVREAVAVDSSSPLTAKPVSFDVDYSYEYNNQTNDYTMHNKLDVSGYLDLDFNASLTNADKLWDYISRQSAKGEGIDFQSKEEAEKELGDLSLKSINLSLEDKGALSVAGGLGTMFGLAPTPTEVRQKVADNFVPQLNLKEATAKDLHTFMVSGGTIEIKTDLQTPTHIVKLLASLETAKSQEEAFKMIHNGLGFVSTHTAATTK